MIDFNFDQFFKFIQIAEKLKTELRHSWTSDSTRQESVAEHSWMISLLAVFLMDKIKGNVDKLKVLKIIIVHDLVESIAGDIPAHEISDRKENKYREELKAIERIAGMLEDKAGQELISLWKEYEERKTLESQIAYALDKAEVLIQHTIADIETWSEGDYRYTFINKQDTTFDFDPFMRKLKNYIDSQTYKKVQSADNLSRIPENQIKRYQEKNNVT